MPKRYSVQLPNLSQRVTLLKLVSKIYIYIIIVLKIIKLIKYYINYNRCLKMQNLTKI